MSGSLGTSKKAAVDTEQVKKRVSRRKDTKDTGDIKRSSRKKKDIDESDEEKVVVDTEQVKKRLSRKKKDADEEGEEVEYTEKNRRAIDLIQRIRSERPKIVKNYKYNFPSPPPGWEETFDKARPYLDRAEMEVNKKMEEYQHGVTYPPSKNVFKAFEYTPLSDVRVLILGQDPYHTGEAMGLAFSGKSKYPVPKSLQNIYKEIKDNYPEWKMPKDGDISHWAKQGVLLLNKCLTVQKGEADSHKGIWDGFTKFIVETVSLTNPKCIYVFWGRKAQEMKTSIKSTNPLILESGHPSPFSYSRYFKGNQHFILINKLLVEELKKEPIAW
jgi:uracil-DNA glycosylase